MHPRSLAYAGILLVAACNPFDDSQVPVVTVGRGLRPQIAWTPEAAYELRVFAGETEDAPPVWYAKGPGGYENALRSPVTYGVPPAGSEVAAAAPLTAGATYTVTVFRMDERGSGEGFTNTRHRYVATLTFVAGK